MSSKVAKFADDSKGTSTLMFKVDLFLTLDQPKLYELPFPIYIALCSPHQSHPH